jgi:16S rRNA (cytosine1402-N4)-methyltransferase
MNNFSHTTVMLTEAVDMLNVKPGKKYIDATLGGGGHTGEIIKRGGVVLGIDQDEDALEYISNNFKFKISDLKLLLVHGNFGDIQQIAEENGFGKVDGILFDLGVSSYQLDTSGRGFSFRKDEKLDMRMDKSSALSAFEVVNHYPQDKLVEIFYKFGEEHNANEIAKAIVLKRKKEEITTTKELAQLIESISHKSEPIHPATRVFQAIRIEVNSEINVLKKSLYESYELLVPKGRVVVISFHSLEDRVVKQLFEDFRKENEGIVVTKKPIIATFDEMSRNRRSRSAKMRVFEKK